MSDPNVPAVRLRMPNSLSGQRALVTGASRGLGAYIARALAREGVQVALVALTREAVAKLAAELTQAGTRAFPIAADLANIDQLGAVVAQAEQALGGIDILINNAGMDGIRSYPSEGAERTEQLVRLNLLSPMLLTQRSLPAMLARKRGHVVSIASLAGKTASPYSATYATTKAGMINFTLSLRSELRGSGVSASVICPGFVRGEGMWAKREQAHPIKVSALLGTSKPEEVANAVLSALHHDRAEIAVNPGPIRMMQALNQFSPDTKSWIQERLLGLNAMLHTIAMADRGSDGSEGR
jgi:short-subunit dehydrogenase